MVQLSTRRTIAVVVALLCFGTAVVGQAGSTAITDVSIRRANVAPIASTPKTSIGALRFSPDSRVLACGTTAGRNVQLDVRQGTLLREIRAEGETITILSFAPDGMLLGSSDGSGAVSVWDTGTGEPIASFVEPGAVHEVGFSVSGSYLVAVGDAQVVRIWDTESWEPRPSIIRHTGPNYAFAISPDKDLIMTGAGDDDPSIRLWSFPAGVPFGSDLDEGRVHDIQYSPSDPHVAISGTQATVWLWEVERVDFLHLIFGGRSPGANVAYSSRGNALVTAAENGVFTYQHVPSVYEQRTIRFDEPLSAIDFSADALYIACGDRAGTVFLLSVP